MPPKKAADATLWIVRPKDSSPFFATRNELLKLAARKSNGMDSPPFTGSTPEQAMAYLKRFDYVTEAA